MAGWLAVGHEGRGHTVPEDDVFEHEVNADGDCWCGPATTPVERDDGSLAWMYTHHAADGREHRERDHDRQECPLCALASSPDAPS